MACPMSGTYVSGSCFQVAFQHFVQLPGLHGVNIALAQDENKKLTLTLYLLPHRDTVCL